MDNLKNQIISDDKSNIIDLESTMIEFVEDKDNKNNICESESSNNIYKYNDEDIIIHECENTSNNDLESTMIEFKRLVRIKLNDDYLSKLTLQDRMKYYEKNNVENILPYKPFIARLDGVNFSKYTQGFEKPFDMLFRTVMILVMNDLVENFSASTGYTQSDEITLIFPPSCSKEEFEKGTNKTNHYRKGRKYKLCSILSSVCTSRFIYHMLELIDKDQHRKQEKTHNRIKKLQLSFDCRLIEYPDGKEYEILNHQIWRSLDCERNAILQYGMCYIGNKNIFKMDCQQIATRLCEMSINYNNPEFILYGVYCKKISYNSIINEKEVQRSKYVNKTFKIKYSDDILNMLFSKYLYTSNDLLEFKDDNDFMITKYGLKCRSLNYSNENFKFEEL